MPSDPRQWPSFIFIREPKILLLKIVMELPSPATNTFLADVYTFHISKGIGERVVPFITKIDGAYMRIYAPDGLDGALQIDRSPAFQHSIGDHPELDLNPFYRRLHTDDPVEIYGEIMYFFFRPKKGVGPVEYEPIDPVEYNLWDGKEDLLE
jgi:hypothetical protein